jgi:hypothetical protein
MRFTVILLSPFNLCAASYLELAVFTARWPAVIRSVRTSTTSVCLPFFVSEGGRMKGETKCCYLYGQF